MRSFFSLLFFAQILLSQTADDQNTVRIAQSFEAAGEYEQAAALYQRLYQKDSLNYVYFDALRRVYIQLKDYDQAIALTVSRLKRTPVDIALRTGLGGLYAIAGKPDLADSLWSAILSTAGKNPIIYRTVAAEQTTRRMFDKAVSTYLLGRRDLGDPAAFANDLAYLYAFTMDYANATREYVRLLEENEQQFDFIKSRMLSYVGKEDGLSSALGVITDELQRRETIPLLRLHQWLLMEEGKYRDAFSDAGRIEHLINSNGTELFQFAEQVFHDHEFATAAQAYEAAIKSGPSMQFVPAARFGYARCYEEMSAMPDSAFESMRNRSGAMLPVRPSYAATIALYDSIAARYRLSPVGVNALYRIGYMKYTRQFDLDGAQIIFDSLLTMFPGGPTAPSIMTSMGDIAIAQGRLDAASTRFRQVRSSSIASPEQRSTAGFRLAEIQFFNDRFDSALALLTPLTEDLTSDESNDALLLQYLITENSFMYPQALQQFARAELLVRQYKVNEAVDRFSSIAETYPDAPLADDALLKKGECSIQLRRYDSALTAYRKILTASSRSIIKDHAQFRIGEVYQYYLGDSGRAIEAYEEVLKNYPHSLYVNEARRRIRQLRGDNI